MSRPFAATPRGLPLAWARILGAVRGRLAYRLARMDRRRADAALGKWLGEDEASRRAHLCRAAFISSGRAEAELSAVRGWSARRLCRRSSLEGWRHLVAAEERGRGVLILPLPSATWPLVPVAVGLYRGVVDLPPTTGGKQLMSWGAGLAPEPIFRPHDTLAAALARLGPGRRVLSPPFDPSFARSSDGGRLRPALAAAEAAREHDAPWVPMAAGPAPDGGFRLVVEPPIEPAGSPNEILRRAMDAIEQEARRRPETFPWWQIDPGEM
ncbi:MAG: hypothetical protein AAF560_06405 [Acidobacteriota bacterium]